MPLPVALAFELESLRLRLLLSCPKEAVIRLPLGSHQVIVNQLSGSCQVVLRKSLGSYQAVEPELLLKRGTLPLFCGTACRLGL